MKSVSAALLACIGLCAQPASIEGLTVDSLTGEPIPRVHVRLITGISTGATAVYGAVSDREGKFSIAAIRPATYIPILEKSGFLFTSAGAKGMPNLTIRPGQQLKGIRMELAPRAILSGRVLDEFGDPVQGSSVSVVSVDPDTASTLLHRETISTDDRGAFRIVTAPGRYFLRASSRGDRDLRDRPEILPDGTKGGPYYTTFYPSTPVKEQARAVDAIGGKEVSGLEIRLSRQKGLSISGVVSGIPEGVIGRVVLQSGQKSGGFSIYRWGMASADGHFEIANIEPGYYRVWAALISKPALSSDIVEFRLEGADQNNLNLRLGPAGQIDGVLQIEGDKTASLPGKPVIQIEGVAGSFSPQYADSEIDPQGAFRLEGIQPGKYRLTIRPLPETAYIKKVELDGSEAPDCVLDFDRGARSSRVKVTVSLRAAVIRGQVLDENGERLASPLATVMLLDPSRKEPWGSELFAQVQPDGRYSFKNVRPGKYRLAAVDAFRVNPNNSQSEMLKLAERGEEIEIQEAARIEKDVRLLPREDPSGKPKQ